MGNHEVNIMQTFTSHHDAIMATPAGTRWSCSFGQPGEGGYSEYLHTPDDRCFIVSNGLWDALKPFTWTLTEGRPYQAGSYRNTLPVFDVRK